MSNIEIERFKHNAKARLIEKVQQYIAERNKDPGMIAQGNVMAAYDVLEQIGRLNRVQSYKLERAIMDAEDYDPSKDKWGFGPVEICPLNYDAFLVEIT